MIGRVSKIRFSARYLEHDNLEDVLRTSKQIFDTDFGERERACIEMIYRSQIQLFSNICRLLATSRIHRSLRRVI